MLTLRLYGGIRSARCPSIRISPPESSTKPPIRFSVVVLPQPDGPSRQKNSPSLISRSVGCSATVLAIALRDAAELDRTHAHRLGEVRGRVVVTAARPPADEGDVDADLARRRGAIADDTEQQPSRLAPDRGRVVGDRGQRRLEQRREVQIVERREGEVLRDPDSLAPGRGERAERKLAARGHERGRPRRRREQCGGALVPAGDRPFTFHDELRVERQVAAVHAGDESLVALMSARAVLGTAEEPDPLMPVLGEVVDQQLNAAAVLERDVPGAGAGRELVDEHARGALEQRVELMRAERRG